MRILVLSDIHANLPAFEAVLETTDGQWDQLWFLGDLVGYGPNPNECVALLQELDHVSLSGNHDWAALGKLDIDDFNGNARDAILRTRSMLNEESSTFLNALPAKRVQAGFTLAHASPRHPIWEYIIDYHTAAANFAHFDSDYCLVGHTHIPMQVEENELGEVVIVQPRNDEIISLEDARFLLNPGSVGQPRDDDPRAAYALLDTDRLTWQFGRVSYPVAETQQQLRQAGFPEDLIGRLSYGW